MGKGNLAAMILACMLGGGVSLINTLNAQSSMKSIYLEIKNDLESNGITEQQAADKLLPQFQTYKRDFYTSAACSFIFAGMGIAVSYKLGRRLDESFN